MIRSTPLETMRCQALLLLVLGFATAAGADVIKYSAVDLGSLPGNIESRPTAINNLGQVVGVSDGLSGGTTGYLYSGGAMSPTESPGSAPGASPTGINDAGQIARQDQDGLANFAINSSGLVVGTDGYRIATTSGGTGMPTFLGGLEPDSRSGASSVSDSGLIAGASTVNGVQHPFLYQNGRMTDLGMLSGQINNLGVLPNGYATGVNDSGQVVGISGAHAFLYTDGRMVDLGTLGGGDSKALGINAAGEVVGWSNTATGAEHAFLYEENRAMDLNDLVASTGGLTLEQAVAINASGQIAVLAVDAEGNDHSLLLTPLAVPEPTSLTVLGLAALSGLAIRSLRRRNQSATN